MKKKQKKEKRKRKFNKNYEIGNTSLFDYFFGWAIPFIILFILVTIMASAI